MVIGNGMVAKSFDAYKTNDGFVIFASGVSNSKNITTEAYTRELTLLLNIIDKYSDKILVYFSTCSLYDPAETESPYVLHKHKIEAIIQQKVASYYIFRVSNLVGESNNPNTILNYFYYHIFKKINFNLWTGSSRNLIDTDDMFRIVDYILQRRIFRNQIINIANPESYNVKDIITALENILNIKANYISIPKGNQFSIDISLTSPVIEELKIDFKETYLNNLLKKYYLNK
jgi:UDP-2-acetamido-2,6-beta-L-arabino-hexul-4-ose reductase